MGDNTMSPLSYALAHIYWGWLICIFFRFRMFQSLVSPWTGNRMSMETSSKLMIALVVLVLLISLPVFTVTATGSTLRWISLLPLAST